jgi:hypothetical protein
VAARALKQTMALLDHPRHLDALPGPGPGADAAGTGRGQCLCAYAPPDAASLQIAGTKVDAADTPREAGFVGRRREGLPPERHVARWGEADSTGDEPAGIVTRMSSTSLPVNLRSTSAAAALKALCADTCSANGGVAM